MADFTELQAQLRSAREGRDRAAADVARTAQALKRLAVERTALERRADPRRAGDDDQRKELDTQERALRATLTREREVQGQLWEVRTTTVLIL
jgi:hypothetical protein